MHIKFLNRGKGKGSTAINYIMSDIDHTKKPRPVAPIVLRGNPPATGALADSLGFEHKYRSAVIAFHPNDKPTNEQLEEVLEEFERVAFAGLESDQYDFCAVLHREADSEHIHIIVPRVELNTGKSLNIAPPGWRNTYDPLRDLFNEKNNWTSPDISQNPEIARITQPSAEGTHKSKSAKTRAEIKQSIESYLLDEIAAGNIDNREDIVQSLESLGFEIPRAGKDYITILDVETKTRTRLKGAIYEQSFTVERTLEATSEQQAQADRTANTERISELKRELENRIHERTEYNQQRYSKPKPQPKRSVEREQRTDQKNKEDADVSMDSTPPYSAPDLFNDLEQHLGSNSIFNDDDQKSDNRDQNKQRQDSESERINEIQREQLRQQAMRTDRSERAGISRWLQNFKETLGEIYDRVRTEIVNRARKIISSIRNGHESVTESSNDLNKASSDIKQSIQNSSRFIERGVRAMRENRNDELEKFKTNINLVEYAASVGYELVKKDSSKNSKAMKSPGGDKIVITTDNDNHGIYFSVTSNDSGSIIDFIQNRQNKNLGEVRKELRKFGGFTDIQDYKSYSKPIKSSKDTAQAAYVLAQATVTDAHPYLLDERKISAETLKDPRFYRSVKIDSRNNAIFPHFNSEGVAGFEIKNRNFTGFAKGGEKGLWYSSNIMSAKRIVIVESAIDALSHAELKETDYDTAYVSIAGSMSAAQLELIKKVIDSKEVVIATDNDSSGNKYAEQIKEFAQDAIREIAELKDWNDDLKQESFEIDRDRGLER